MMLVVGVMLVAASVEARKGKGRAPEPARERYETAAWSVARPPGEGWIEAPHRPGDVVLVRDGAADVAGGPDDSWSAQVLVLPPQSLASAEAMTTWLDQNYRARLMEDGRFEQRAWTVTPAPDRGPSCVSYRLATLDLQALLSTGAIGTLLLDERGLACESSEGLVLAKLSWRGRGDAAHPLLDRTAATWLSTFSLKAGAGN